MPQDERIDRVLDAAMFLIAAVTIVLVGGFIWWAAFA